MLTLQNFVSSPAVPAVAARADRSVAPREDFSPEALDHLARIATIPHVVEHASRMPPSARLGQIAFVGGLAFGRGDIDARVGRRFVEQAYAATTRTAKRLTSDLAHSRIWEEWEGCCLLRACAVLAGQLRVVLAADDPIDDWTTAR
jgi:hypothetical protein